MQDATIAGTIIGTVIAFLTGLAAFFNGWRKDNRMDERVETIVERLAGDEFVKNSMCGEIQKRMLLQFENIIKSIEEMKSTLHQLNDKVDSMQITLAKIDRNGNGKS